LTPPSIHGPEITGPPVSEEQGIQLLDYWRILVQRRLVVFSCLAVVFVATMSLTLLTTPQYRATTTLEIQRNAPEIVEFTDVVGVDPGAYMDFHQTQLKILQSRTVARIASGRLDLVNRPEFAGRKGSPIRRFRRWTESLFAGEKEPGSQVDAGIGFIQGNLAIALIRRSFLVNVSFEDRDPTLAADVANAVAAAYQQFQLDARYNTTGQAKEFLTKDVARVQAEIGILEHTLQEYGVEKEILALSDGTQDISYQALADINSRYTAGKGRLAAAKARYLGVRQAPSEALPEVLNSPILGHLRQRQAELERKHSQMAKRFRPGWPQLDQLNEELSTAQAQLETEAENIARRVRAVAQTKYTLAQAELDLLEEYRAAQTHEVQRVSADAIEYASLKTEIETKRKVLANLVTRQSETETSYRLKDTGASNVRVVDRAEVPQAPFKPNKTLNLLLSIVFGLGLGGVLALLVDYLDNTVKTEQDIQGMSHLTVLGHVPLSQPLTVVTDESGKSQMHDLDLESHDHPRSHFSESFRNLRTSLLLAAPDHPPRHVLVTSCEPGDGKSTIAVNLAIVLTQLGRRVLLVDADLRRPRLHRTLGLDQNEGLSNYLSGNADLNDIIHDTDIPNLRVIPGGPIPPNPSELLGSPRLDVLLGRFLEENRFDHLVLDSPPLLSVADSVVLSSTVESTILVVRSGSTRREALTQSAARLRHSRANVIGVVLNAVTEETGYYYRYRYRRYYTEKETVPEKSRLSLTLGMGKRRDRSRKAG